MNRAPAAGNGVPLLATGPSAIPTRFFRLNDTPPQAARKSSSAAGAWNDGTDVLPQSRVIRHCLLLSRLAVEESAAATMSSRSAKLNRASSGTRLRLRPTQPYNPKVNTDRATFHLVLGGTWQGGRCEVARGKCHLLIVVCPLSVGCPRRLTTPYARTVTRSFVETCAPNFQFPISKPLTFEPGTTKFMNGSEI